MGDKVRTTSEQKAYDENREDPNGIHLSSLMYDEGEKLAAQDGADAGKTDEVIRQSNEAKKD